MPFYWRLISSGSTGLGSVTSHAPAQRPATSVVPEQLGWPSPRGRSSDIHDFGARVEILVVASPTLEPSSEEGTRWESSDLL